LRVERFVSNVDGHAQAARRSQNDLPAELLFMTAASLVGAIAAVALLWQKRRSGRREGAVQRASTIVGEGEPAPAPPEGLAAASCERQESAECSTGDEDVNLLYEPGAEDEEITAPIDLFFISAAGDSDGGQKRKRNEDNFLALPERGIFAVADGMGGHAGGHVASSLAVDTLRRAFEDEFDELSSSPQIHHHGRELARAVRLANRAIFEAARSRPEIADMGTTLVSLRFSSRKRRLYVGHVGDSRCYRLRGNELRQLTKDHVMRELGVGGPMANHLFTAVGIRENVAIDLLVDTPQLGDVYMLCSDGLFKMVSESVIRQTLIDEPEPEHAVYSLIEKANDAGGKDNITVVLAKVVERRAAGDGVESSDDLVESSRCGGSPRDI
jgi:serine/threonine protein phosphatase PrpC